MGGQRGAVRRRWLASTGIIGTLFVYYYYWWLPVCHIRNLRSARHQVGAASFLQQSASSVKNDDKIILYWTKYFEWTDFGVGTGRRPFLNARCNVTNCVTTTDRSLLNSSHAILFHARDLDPDDLPPPGWRTPNQKYVFFNYESPAHTNLGQLKLLFTHYFNWTMTYRRDSDVVSLQPYGRLVEEANPSWGIRKLVRLKEKNRTAAWFVSNCRTESRRESLARNLSQHMPVDIYGSCGHRKCVDRTECNRMLQREYRFYLSFENSLCTDYVTEKLYRALEHDVVPVVFGGADYDRFLPAGSYINAMDFKSPSQLASYLLHLMKDDDAYLNFFRWKERFRVEKEPLDGWCRLCQLLNDPAKTAEKKSYDIALWWAGQGNNLSCHPPPASLADSDDDSSGSIHRLLGTLQQIVRNALRR